MFGVQFPDTEITAETSRAQGSVCGYLELTGAPWKKRSEEPDVSQPAGGGAAFCLVSVSG